ncbi:MAG TPA: DUF1573 domain-containing protein, partial [Isosphaeraceae bacterium]|nr:DUF1573 domain-containing protein [Isosphaeraceae bacterium]
MMRWILLAVLVVALTAGATALFQYLPASATTNNGPAFPSSPTAESAGPPAHAAVDQDLAYDFGSMSQHSTNSHEWTVTNEGPGDLTLELGKASCSCTKFRTTEVAKEGEKQVLKKGQSTKVLVEWDTKDNNGSFSQTASVITPNDPARQMIVLVIRGHVTP